MSDGAWKGELCVMLDSEIRGINEPENAHAENGEWIPAGCGHSLLFCRI